MDSQNRLVLADDEEKKISFDILDAGPGVLLAEVRGSFGFAVYTNGEGLSFTPPQVGEYVAKLLWNRVLFLIAPHVVGITRSNDLPSKSRASSISSTGSDEDHKVVLTKAIFGVEVFTIDGSRDDPGVPKVTMMGIKFVHCGVEFHG